MRRADQAWQSLTMRQRRILLLLYNKRDGLTIERIAQALELSSRTVRTECAAIDQALTDTDISFSRKPGKGVLLLVPNAQDQAFFQQQCALRQSSRLCERKMLIAGKLLLAQKKGLTEAALAQQLFVSRSSISKELVQLQDWFADFSLRIVKRKNYGIFLEGSEWNRRIALAKLFALRTGRMQDEALQGERRAGRIAPKHRQVLSQLYAGFDSHPVEQMLAALEEENRISLQQGSYVTLWFAICTCVYRLLTGHVVDITAKKMPELFIQNRMLLAERSAAMLQSRYHLTIPPPEMAYLSMHIEAAGIHRSEAQAIERILLAQDASFQLFLQDVVHTIETILDVDLSGDGALMQNFAYHLSCAVFRMRYHIRIPNPLLQEIKTNYPSIFGATWACSVLFEKYYNLKVTEDEIGFLSLYVGIAAERIRHVVRACVVCNYGIGVSGLLSESIQSAIPHLLVADVLSSGQYHQMRARNLGAWELVITTMALEEQGLPVVRVSTILTGDDLQRINQAVRRIVRARGKPEQARPLPPSSLLKESLIFLDHPARDKQEVLRFVCGRLQEAGCVTGAFLPSVMEREHIISTEIGAGLAIPHGNPAYVLRPAIAAVRLARPIRWENDTGVDLLFVLALKMEAGSGEVALAKDFYKKLAHLLDDAQLQQQLRGATSASAFYQCLT
nr:PRD domain-containing protein [Maliibacterium massiliense]